MTVVDRTVRAGIYTRPAVARSALAGGGGGGVGVRARGGHRVGRFPPQVNGGPAYTSLLCCSTVTWSTFNVVIMLSAPPIFTAGAK